MKKHGVSNIFGTDARRRAVPGALRAAGVPDPGKPVVEDAPDQPDACSSHEAAGATPKDPSSCPPATTRYPFVATTYRVTEHWQTGLMTRNTPWLLEMQPQNFLEMSRELAAEKGIKNGDMVEVSSARGEISCKAIVTGRFKPFKVMGVTVHQVGMPWCFGWHYPGGRQRRRQRQPADARSSATPNTMIPESKAFMVNVRKSPPATGKPANKTAEEQGEASRSWPENPSSSTPPSAPAAGAARPPASSGTRTRRRRPRSGAAYQNPPDLSTASTFKLVRFSEESVTGQGPAVVLLSRPVPALPLSALQDGGGQEGAGIGQPRFATRAPSSSIPR